LPVIAVMIAVMIITIPKVLHPIDRVGGIAYRVIVVAVAVVVAYYP